MNARVRLGGSRDLKAAMVIMFLLAVIQALSKYFGNSTNNYPAHAGSLNYESMLEVQQRLSQHHGTIHEDYHCDWRDHPSTRPASIEDIITYSLGALALFVAAKSLYRLWRNAPPQDQQVEIGDELDQDQDQNFSDSEEQVNVLRLPVEDNEHEKRLAAVGFNGEIPAEFLDPIDKTIMFNPVILLTSDHTTTRSFEEMSILRLMCHEDKPVCPLSRRPFSGYILNRDLKQIIGEWVDQTVRAAQTGKLNEMPRQRAENVAQMAQQFFHKRKPRKLTDETQMTNHETLRKSY